MFLLSFALYVATFLVLATVYVHFNDRALTLIPQRALKLAQRWTRDDFDRIIKELEGREADSLEEKKRAQTPPKTGRQYIITGGSGFVGSYIITQLIQRGEDPKNIRILDLRPPNRRDFLDGPASQVPFVKVDITSKEDVEAAFTAPWPNNDSQQPEITVFHTAAIIRFQERHPSLLHLSEKINVQGTQNVIDASKKVGATVLISTSSGSVAHWSAGRLLLAPWEWYQFSEKSHKSIMLLGDQEAGGEGEKSRGILPTKLEDFVTIYSYTKLVAERLVRGANKSSTGLESNKLIRTGALRPANAIYGPAADMYEYFLQTGENNISFSMHSVTNQVHVENVALAHLLYEDRLLHPGSTDIGGQAFVLTDPGAPSITEDVQKALTYFVPHFSGGKLRYKCQSISPTILLILANFIEKYYLLRLNYPTLGSILPALSPTLLPLQPSTLGLALVHTPVDDSRARLPAEKGGLGYIGVVDNNLEGLARCVKEYCEKGSLRLPSDRKGFGHGS